MKFIKRHKLIKESDMGKELKVPKPIWNLHDIFLKNGKKLYLVGGSVRDFLNKETPKDFDLATDATPKEMINMLISEFGLKRKVTDKDGNDKEFDLNNGLKLNLQGAQFGVLVIYNLDGLDEGVEIATFREDLTKGRNPDVKIGATIEKDVGRRDLTFNGLFYDLSKKEIVDLVGGVEDLNNKIVRMIGNPVDRIEEDKLRILRCFRFASRYGSDLDKETEQAIRNNSELNEVSSERIWEEFNKAFKQSSSFNNYLEFIEDFDMWSQIFPGLEVSIDGYKEVDNIILCLAQLLKGNDFSEVRKKMVKDIQSPSDVANAVSFLISLKSFDVEDVPSIVKGRDRFKVSDELISKWFDIENLNSPLHKALIGFTPSVNSIDVMNDLNIETDVNGNPKNKADGQKLGKEIFRRKVIQFKDRI